MAYIKHILDLIAKNQIKIFFKKNYKKPQGLYALRFALKRAFNNTV